MKLTIDRSIPNPTSDIMKIKAHNTNGHFTEKRAFNDSVLAYHSITPWLLTDDEIEQELRDWCVDRNKYRVHISKQ